MTREERFWAQRAASDKLYQAMSLLKQAKADFDEAGYWNSVGHHITCALQDLERADRSMIGVHAHACRGWMHGQSSASELV